MNFADGATTIVLMNPCGPPIRNVPFNLIVISERPTLAEQEAVECSEAI